MSRWLPLTAVVSATLLMPACREDAVSPGEPSVPDPAFATAPATLTFKQVVAGGGHACGLTADGRAYCWGSNGLGQLGNGGTVGTVTCLPFDEPDCTPRPVAVVGGLRFRQLSAGVAHTCGITTDDRAYCWGYNGVGALGDGTTTIRLAPVAVSGGRTFRQITAGGATCGLATDNVLYCWGGNTYGEVGDGTTTNRLVPTLVAGGRKYRQVSAGGSHTCALTTADEAFCWGRNTVGQVGDGTDAVLRRRPVRVAGGFPFRQIDAGGVHTCAVTAEKAAYCWGWGHLGQIGDGKVLSRYAPRAVRGGHAFVRVAAGNEHTCGETTTNQVYCWGSNGYGEAGNGNTAPTLVPSAATGGLSFAQVSAGDRFTCGRTAADLAYCWGDNHSGQLGDGTQEDRLTPTPVVGP